MTLLSFDETKSFDNINVKSTGSKKKVKLLINELNRKLKTILIPNIFLYFSRFTLLWKSSTYFEWMMRESWICFWTLPKMVLHKDTESLSSHNLHQCLPFCRWSGSAPGNRQWWSPYSAVRPRWRLRERYCPLHRYRIRGCRQRMPRYRQASK